MVVKIIKKGDGSIVKIPVKKVKAKTTSPANVKRPLTLRDIKVLELVANGGKKAPSMIKAGFSPRTARTPRKFFDRPAIAQAIDDYVERLKKHREVVIKRMEKTVGKAGYAVLSMSQGQLTRDIELLSGKPTSREEHIIPEEEAAKLDELVDLNG